MEMNSPFHAPISLPQCPSVRRWNGP